MNTDFVRLIFSRVFVHFCLSIDDIIRSRTSYFDGISVDRGAIGWRGGGNETRGVGGKFRCFPGVRLLDIGKS